MKNRILTLALIAFVTISCNQNKSVPENETVNTTETTEQMYACPMHPEIIGKKGATCSECGMELTEPVVATEVKTESEE